MGFLREIALIHLYMLLKLKVLTALIYFVKKKNQIFINCFFISKPM